MSTGKDLADFPNVTAKLQKPTKKSAFEKQKAEAAAKRQREAAENAAVLKDFVDSFDRDDDYGGGGPVDDRRGFGGGRGSYGGPTPRRFGGGGSGGPPKSGPGSLGPLPPAGGGLGKKRPFGDYARDGRDTASTLLGFDDNSDDGGNHRDEHGSRRARDKVSSRPVGRDNDRRAAARAFDVSDDEDNAGPGAATARTGGVGGMASVSGHRTEDRAVAKPTLRLSNLPPSTSPAAVKALIPSSLTVDNVKLISAGTSSQTSNGAAGHTDRQCAVAIVTLSHETPANDIDAAVSLLQHRYLGYGYYLSLHRHLSSAVRDAASAGAPNLTSAAGAADAHPFGAKLVEPERGSQHQGQRDFRRGGFAPPSSYADGRPGAVSRANLMHVPVKPPQDVQTIQLINKVIERLLEHGPEFEALLMSRPEVQREERWAWLWNARSTGGVWYRWKLWEIITGSQQSATSKGKFVPLFDGGHAWKAPDKRLVFEYVTRLDEIVSDSDYNSSDEEDLDGERDGQGGPPIEDGEAEKTFLNPVEKAQLTHFLARLPTNISRLRKGDIARVTAFALLHASRGVDEIVDLIVSNVERPFSLTAANPSKKTDRGDATAEGAEETTGDAADVGAASLVSLYAINDILSSSSTSGIRHAWRFRQLFEGALRQHKTFEHLGLMAEKQGWGRLRADKWKRSIGVILNLWEGWCVFPVDSQEYFASSFENPPSLKVDEDRATEDDAQTKARWKVVEAAAAPEPSTAPALDDVEGEAIGEEDVEGEPVYEDDVEGDPIDDNDVEGEPMDEDDVEGDALSESEAVTATAPQGKSSAAPSAAQSEGGQPASEKAAPRRRMRAVDMFADSDSDGGGR